MNNYYKEQEKKNDDLVEYLTWVFIVCMTLTLLCLWPMPVICLNAGFVMGVWWANRGE